MQKRLMRITWLQSIVVKAVSAERVGEAEEQITSLLRQRHRIGPDRDDDFNVRNLSDIADAATTSARVMAVLLGSVASISLLVGGIGIMNIMLVSVTERTREIGTRLAVGAMARDVLLQFLVEAVTLAAFGGIIGIALGLSAAALATSAFRVPFVFNPGIVIVSFAFSAAVGIVFGYFPARRAAQLDPIEALRHE
jgi:putative ABC transport system permease protein